MAPPRIADKLGRVLGGRFRLIAPLGTGASAHVYVAEDVRLRRRVAVKVLHPALAGDETFLRRFRGEAEAVAALRHPHLMQVFDWGEDEDGPYLVLEYLAGGSLRDMLDRGALLTPSQATLLGIDAGGALAHAHRRGLVHRDIKPANLLFDEEGRVVIADFGLARALAEAAWTEPAGAIAGTARYAAPEQAKGSRVDGKADVYALALVLIEAVTGQVPFAADTTIATLMARVDKDLIPPAALGPLASALAPAGAADPEDRIDAAALVTRLEDATADLPRPDALPVIVDDEDEGAADLTILPPSVLASTTSASGDGGVFDDAPPPLPKSRRRKRIVWTVVAVLVTLAALAIVLGRMGIVAAFWLPSHPVPELRGMTYTAALAEVEDEGFDVKRWVGAYSEDVPRGQIIEQDPAPASSLREQETVHVRVSKGPEPRAVPELTGKTADAAKATIEERRLVYAQADEYSDTVAKGVVIDWAPKGEDVPRDSPVTVRISLGREPKAIPDLVDKLYDEAKKALEDLGFIATRKDVFDDDVESGKVVSTAPPNGTESQPGEEVELVVSKGPDLVRVPDVSNLREGDAEERLQAAGLQLGNRFGPRNGRVFTTTPEAGTQVKRGSVVHIYTR